MAEESQDIFFEMSSSQIHSILHGHLGEERHHIETDHYIVRTDVVRTRGVHKCHWVSHVMWRVASVGAK
jgi:hypothetical protein